jgi:hypothetical protein
MLCAGDNVPESAGPQVMDMDFEEFFRAQILRVVGSGRAAGSDFAGLSDAEVDEVEAAQRRSLSLSYRAYLRTMGRSAGPVFSGTDVSYPHVLWFRDAAEQVADSIPVDIAGCGTVFSVHQGYDFLVHGSDPKDPAVYRLTDSSSQLEEVSVTFTSFVAMQVEDLLKSQSVQMDRRRQAWTMDEIRREMHRSAEPG